MIQYRKKEDAYVFFAECASSVPEARKHFFLEQLGIFLVLLYAIFLAFYLVIEGHLAAKRYDQAKRVERKYKRRLRELSRS